MKIIDSLIHRYFRLPYTLHVYHHSKIEGSRSTIVFLHGIGSSARAWNDVIDELPDSMNANIIALDLLGFGSSPQPDWAMYSASTQAKAVAKTLLARGHTGSLILVGHSMGALVAVELARRYPVMVESLVLCSPPLYVSDSTDDKKFLVKRDEQLRRLYEFAIKNPKNIVRFSQLARRYKILNPHFDVDHLNVDSYISALRANVLNQTTVSDIVKIKKPIDIVYGAFDPFVVNENIKSVEKLSDYITVSRFLTGHEVIGRYAKKVVSLLVEKVGQAK